MDIFEGQGNSWHDYFIFYGNGKMDIGGMGEGEFFVKADSIIVYPYKNISKSKFDRDWKIRGFQLGGPRGLGEKIDTLIQYPQPIYQGRKTGCNYRLSAMRNLHRTTLKMIWVLLIYKVRRFPENSFFIIISQFNQAASSQLE